MNNAIDRDGIIVLDDAQLKAVGNRVVGGDFSATLELATGAVTVLAAVLGACYWLINPANRRNTWEIFMSNFRRTTVAAVTTAASVASSTPATAVDDLQAVDAVLDGSSTSLSAFQSCLNIIDDPNEV
jgi:hypothetical protein